MIPLLVKGIYFFIPLFAVKLVSSLINNHFPGQLPLSHTPGLKYTWLGIGAGIFSGTVIFVMQKYLFNVLYQLSIIDYADFSVFYGLALSLGAMLGDLLIVLIKQKYGLPAQEPWIPWDAWGYLLGGLIFSFWYYVPDVLMVVVGLAVALLGQLLLAYGKSVVNYIFHK